MEEFQQTIADLKIVWFDAIQNGDNISQDNIFCQKCEEVDYTNENQIVLCDGCDAAVHQYCYQIIHLEDQWYCQRCQSIIDNPNGEIHCEFCPESYQLLEKVLIDNVSVWAHSSCLKWNKLLKLNSQSSNIYTSSGICITGFKCRYCLKSEGYQIKCQFQKCESYFHIGCVKSNGGIQGKLQMECLYNYAKPYLLIQEEQQLICVEHFEEIYNKIEKLEDKQIYNEQFWEPMKIRYAQFYIFNKNGRKQKSKINETKIKKQNYEDALFSSVYSIKQLKEAKVEIKDKKVRAQFKEFMTKRLNERLHELRDDFQKKNIPSLNDLEDKYIQVDVALSKKIFFDKIIDVNNLEEFDKYLVNFFIYNNMIRKPTQPTINITEETQHASFWKKLLEEIGVKNGEQFGIFMNQLRLKKMHIVSKVNEKLQEEHDLEEQFGFEVNDLKE